MRISLFTILALLMTGSQSHSAALTVTFTNMSGDAINAVTAIPKGAVDAEATNLLAAPITNGEPADVSIQADDGQCVFDLNFAFASGKTLERPDTDLCQTDGIMVE